MKIEHIALYVDDLEGAKHFFTAYFGGLPAAVTMKAVSSVLKEIKLK